MSFAQGAPTQPLVFQGSNVFLYGSSTSGNAFTVQQLSAGNVASFQTSTGATGLIVNPTGLVGIGKTNPAYALDVTGDINFTGTFRQNGTAYVGSQWTGTSTLYFAGNVGIGATTSPSYPLDVSGIVRAGSTLGSSIYLTNSEVKWRGDGTAHFSIFNQNSTFQIRNTSANAEPGTAGSNLITINTTGNIGIGVTTPQTALWVPATSTTTGIGIYNADVAMILGNTAGSTNSNTGSIQIRAGGSATGIGTTTYTLALNPEGGNVAIGANTGTAIPSQFYVKSSTVTGATSVPTGTVMTIDKSDGGILTFRNSNDNGTYSGVAFVDNNIGGFMLFRNYTGASSQYGDALHISGYNGVFIYGQTTGSVDPSQQTIIMSCTYKQNGTSGVTNTACVGIGTSNPAYKLHVSGGDASVTYYGPTTTWGSYLMVGAGGNYSASQRAQVMCSNGNLHIDCGQGGYQIYLNFYQGGGSGGTNATVGCYAPFFATGDITAFYSDERLKTKTGTIENALDKVCSLNAFKYVHNDIARQNGFDGDEVHVGLSAQEVQKVLPEVVTRAPFDMGTDYDVGLGNSRTGENYLTIKYERMVPLLVEALKEERAERLRLQDRLERLEKLLLQDCKQ